MYQIIKIVKPCVFVCLLSALWGCSITGSSSPIDGGSPIVLFEPSKVPLTFGLTAVAKLNPDQNGRPSPLVLRVYQLSSDSLFKNADFYSLFDNDTQVLGRDLQKKQQMMIYPGDKKPGANMILDRKTRFIGVLGAFRDLDNAVATLIIPIDPEEPAPLCLRINAKSLVLDNNC